MHLEYVVSVAYLAYHIHNEDSDNEDSDNGDSDIGDRLGNHSLLNNEKYVNWICWHYIYDIFLP